MNFNMVMGIDPGLSGAFVITNGEDFVEAFHMPLFKIGKEKIISHEKVFNLLTLILDKNDIFHIFLERAVPMAMGSKGAFNYGRGFEAVVSVIERLKMPFTLVEPAKWTKEMHEGISQDLKPKAKSMIAVQRLYPKLVGKLPQKPKGGLQEGPMDALLIAGFGLRRLNPREEVIADFY